LAQAGIAYVVYGRPDFGDLNVGAIDNPPGTAQPGLELEGAAAGDGFGAAQDSAGDFNGDGVPDWLVGAPGRGGNGIAAVVFGDANPDLQPTGSFDADDLGTADLPSVVFEGASSDDEAGAYVSHAGDVNGDGIDDILVAAPGADGEGKADAGRVYVIFGQGTFDVENGETFTLDQVGTGELEGWILIGPEAGAQIGTVAAAGDVDGDGFDDILIGYVAASPLGRTNAGQVFLIYGDNSLTP
jgi:hypothetical protein